MKEFSTKNNNKKTKVMDGWMIIDTQEQRTQGKLWDGCRGRGSGNRGEKAVKMGGSLMKCWLSDGSESTRRESMEGGKGQEWRRTKRRGCDCWKKERKRKEKRGGT